MKLREYLKRREITLQAFADSLGVSKGLVWQWLHGHTNITGQMALRIEKATDRAIRRQDLLPELYKDLT